MKKPRPIAFSYVRMSTGAQLKGDSLRRQTELSSKYAIAHGLEMAGGHLYHDIGVSAFKGSNSKDGALGKFVAAAESGAIPKGSFLLCESFDRLSREEVTSALTLFLRIVKAGVTLVTLADQRVYRPGLELHDLLYSIMSMSRAHEESEMKSRRIGASWVAKRRRAASGRITSLCPAWLKPNSNNHFDVIQTRARVVRDIFSAAASGQGSYTIARLLNKKRVPKFTDKGNPGWQPSYITKILTNRSVLGEFQPHKMEDGKRIPDGDPIQSYFPRIVDDAVFYKAQAGRSDRKTAGSGRKGKRCANLFSRLLICGNCGGAIHFINKGRGEEYFQCDRARRSLGCSKKSYRYSDFETSFLSFVSEVDLRTLFKGDEASKKRMLIEQHAESIRGQLAAVQSQREATFALLGDGASSGFIKAKLDDMSVAIANLKKSSDAATAELSRLDEEERAFTQNQNDLATFISRLKDADAADIEELRMSIAGRIKSVVSIIHVYADGIESVAEYGLKLLKDSGKLNECDFEEVRTAMLSEPLKDRRFTVKFKSGAGRTVYPSPTNPARLVSGSLFDEKLALVSNFHEPTNR